MATNEDINDTDRLQELDGSDFEIADGQPDIKGWDVKDTNGANLGDVYELIFDSVSRKVLYLVVDLSGNDFSFSPRKVLVPIGLATLHAEEDEVILAELTARQLNLLPEYEKGKIIPAVEANIRNAFSGLAAAIAAGSKSYESHPEDFYQHKHFDQEHFYNGRTKKL